jgi:hypothetical protein
MLAPLVIGAQALRQGTRFARRDHRLAIVVLVVRHRYFAGGAVLGEAVSLVAVAVVAGRSDGGCVPASAAGAPPLSGWPSGSLDGTVAGCEGGLPAGIAGVAEVPELMYADWVRGLSHAATARAAAARAATGRIDLMAASGLTWWWW